MSLSGRSHINGTVVCTAARVIGNTGRYVDDAFPFNAVDFREMKEAKKTINLAIHVSTLMRYRDVCVEGKTEALRQQGFERST